MESDAIRVSTKMINYNNKDANDGVSTFHSPCAIRNPCNLSPAPSPTCMTQETHTPAKTKWTPYPTENSNKTTLSSWKRSSSVTKKRPQQTNHPHHLLTETEAQSSLHSSHMDETPPTQDLSRPRVATLQDSPERPPSTCWLFPSSPKEKHQPPKSSKTLPRLRKSNHSFVPMYFYHTSRPSASNVPKLVIVSRSIRQQKIQSYVLVSIMYFCPLCTCIPPSAHICVSSPMYLYIVTKNLPSLNTPTS